MSSIQSQYQHKPSPWSSHSQIKNKLGNLKTGSRVLDIGTATGIIGQVCQEFGLEIYGIEPNREWAAAAGKYYREIKVGLVEEISDSFLSNYDAVVFADILEHTPQPEDILKRIVALQPAGTKIIISVPNAANIWVRLHLLMGNFDYQERGILDKTHLRFFTRKIFVRMIKNCGLEIESVQPTPIPLEFISPFFNTSFGLFLYKIFAKLTQLFPTLLGYQFVAETRKL
jgi:2-polyprenyl-3-methyl-5-hydroxy-6-metoxy-1,4-benzoquinol methylase